MRGEGNVIWQFCSLYLGECLGIKCDKDGLALLPIICGEDYCSIILTITMAGLDEERLIDVNIILAPKCFLSFANVMFHDRHACIRHIIMKPFYCIVDTMRQAMKGWIDLQEVIVLLVVGELLHGSLLGFKVHMDPPQLTPVRLSITESFVQSLLDVHERHTSKGYAVVYPKIHCDPRCVLECVGNVDVVEGLQVIKHLHVTLQVHNVEAFPAALERTHEERRVAWAKVDCLQIERKHHIVGSNTIAVKVLVVGHLQASKLGPGLRPMQSRIESEEIQKVAAEHQWRF